uniref:Uncharacterized protein n=1 Tax=Gopherus evgoodei TaxID=1825980 RepID=A0A8C4Y4T9_9SAUR
MAQGVIYADLRFVKAPRGNSTSFRSQEEGKNEDDVELTYENIQAPAVLASPRPVRGPYPVGCALRGPLPLAWPPSLQLSSAGLGPRGFWGGEPLTITPCSSAYGD